MATTATPTGKVFSARCEYYAPIEDDVPQDRHSEREQPTRAPEAYHVDVSADDERGAADEAFKLFSARYPDAAKCKTYVYIRPVPWHRKSELDTFVYIDGVFNNHFTKPTKGSDYEL